MAQTRLPAERDLAAWLQTLEAMQPDRIELGLDRVGAVAERVGLLRPAFRIVTVAGTNGKGSTAGYVSAMLRAAGYRVGSYTSPHFLEFNERIAVDDKWVADAPLVAAFEAIERARGDTALTYFEFTTLAAVEHFRSRQIDIAVLEVGLGGRLDAVNLWDSDVACVTSIGIDHVDWLGDNREVIGREKAAIARVGCALVCGDPEPPDSIASTAQAIGATLWQLGRDFEFERRSAGWRYRSAMGDLELPSPAIPAEWAVNNAATAITVCSQLIGSCPERAWIIDALASVMPAGRAQQASYRGVDLLLDVAHNPAAASQLAHYLGQHPATGATRAVFGCMMDKDAESIISMLSPYIDGWYIGEIDYDRAMSGAHLQAMLSQQRAETAVYPSVTTALEQAVAQSSLSDRVVVFGSFLTVSEVMLAMDGLHAH